MAATARLEAPLPAAALVQARVLGGFEVDVAGHPLARADWQRLSAERLVKLLLVTPGHRLTREVAAETLWPDAAPEASQANLRKALYFARRALGAPGAVASIGDVLSLDTGLVALDLDRLVGAFNVLGRRGSPRRTASVADAVETVLRLGPLPLLPDDPYEEWLAAPREQLRSRWQTIAIEAAREAAASERRPEAHAILERILERDPADEEAHRLSIELYALEGRYHAVRRQFDQCRRALAARLDASPSAETEAAYQAAERAAHARRLPATSILVGRRREMGLIEPVLEQVAAGRFGAIVIRGPVGIGKTRLLEALRDQARSLGWWDLVWHALQATRSIAFAPFALRLGDEVTVAELEAWDEPARSGLAAVVPSLAAAGHLTFADRSALRVALLAALARLAARAPRLLAIDDLAALDEASLELLESASSVLSSAPVLVAATYRDEEPLPEPARELIETLRRSGSLEMRLGPLGREDVEPLLTGRLGGEAVAEPLSEALFARSEGNPLFCLGLAREASDRGLMRLEAGCWALIAGGSLGDAPETVRHLVMVRSAALPAGAQELLRVAAELGQAEFGYDTLSAVLPDLGGGLIAALDAALASGLLVERGAGYAFGHPLYRRAIEASAGRARRAGTHLAIARALAGISPGDDSAPSDVTRAATVSPDPLPVAEQAVRAYELGRTEAAVLAVAFGLAAAARARTLFDQATATRFFERALDVWSRLSPNLACQFDASDAYSTLAELRMAAGDEAGAESAFRSAITAARDPEEVAIVYDRFTFLPYRHGDLLAAIALCEEGLARLPADASVAQAILRGNIESFRSQLDPAQSVDLAALEGIVRAMEAAGNRTYLSEVLDALGTEIALRGRPDEGLRLIRRSLAIDLDRRDARAEVRRRLHIANVLVESGRPAEARSHMSRALELAEQMGEWFLESACAWMAAEAEDQLGNLEAARQLRLREIALLSRIGGNPPHEAWAHAHLAHIARLLGDAETEKREASRAREVATTEQASDFPARVELAMSVADWSDAPKH